MATVTVKTSGAKRKAGTAKMYSGPKGQVKRATKSKAAPSGNQVGRLRTGGMYGRFPPSGNETKFFDTALSFLFDATGEVPATGQLNLIPQGVTESTRVGRLCCLKSIQIRGIAQWSPAAGTTASSTQYLYLVLDTQTNGAAAAITDVLTSNNMAVALINLNNSQRFRILKRFVIPMTSQAGVSGAFGNVVVPIDYFKKLDIALDFSSTTGAITEIRSNNLFLLAGSDTLADDVGGFAGTCRVRFADG